MQTGIVVVGLTMALVTLVMFSTTPLALTDWVSCAVLASAVLSVAEIRKWLLRRAAPPARIIGA